MADVLIYRTTYCPYCDMAKRLFQSLDIEFDELDVTEDDAMRAKLMEMTGGKRTVPQIFIHGQSVGGYTDVRDLHSQGKLLPMVQGAE